MKENLKIKVCGMKFTANRREVEKLPVDFLGFIFYPNSKRYVGDKFDMDLFNTVKPKVAVFVNENITKIFNVVDRLNFQFVQLHGQENPSSCEILKKLGIKVIKAFNIDERFDFSMLDIYANSVDFFLFDTKTNLPGGSGKRFNWKILKKYTGQTPFFLSGGIQPVNAKEIRQIVHPQLFGLDINSRFEDEPGLKNIEKIKNFIKEIKR